MPRSYTVTDPTGVLTIDFNNTNDTNLLVPDVNGCFWFIEELLGWDGPDVRQVLVDPYGEDGVIVGVNELSDRLVTLSNGFCAAPTEAAKWTAQLQFGQLMAATIAQGECLLTVHEDIDRFVNGYLASKPEWKDVPPGALASYLPGAYPFQFEASLVCPISVKQSSIASTQALTRNGAITIPTLGNYPAWPVLVMDYPVNGDYIEDTNNTGRKVQITDANRGSSNAAPPMPTSISIDMGQRTVVDQNGAPAWDVIQSIQFFQILPNSGTSLTYHLGTASPTGTQEAQCNWNDAWL